MDSSTSLNFLSIVISLFSIIISIIFAIMGIHFSNKSDKTLTIIQTKIEVQHDVFITLLRDTMSRYDEYVTNVMRLMFDMTVHKGKGTSEEVEDLDEAIQELRQKLNLDPTLVMSKQSKVGERKEHG